MQIIYINNKHYQVPELYQPVPGTENHKRDCIDRLNTILMADMGYNSGNLFKGSISDWGSSLGYFTMEFASRTDNNVYGIDFDSNNIALSNAIKESRDIKNAEFIHGKVPDNVPDSDSHIVLSVLHHQMKEPAIPGPVINKFKSGNTIYLELAHHNESPDWSENLVYSEDITPILYWKRQLERDFGEEFNVRIIGVHPTHLGSLRSMYLVKRNINESIEINNETYIIYDRFKTGYNGFWDHSDPGGNPSEKNIGKSDTDYAYAIKDDTRYFIKFVNNKAIRVEPYIDGLLLSDIIKFGILPYYNRSSIKRQLREIADNLNHKDPHFWNFIIDSESIVHSIDSNDDVSMIPKEHLKSMLNTNIAIL